MDPRLRAALVSGVSVGIVAFVLAYYIRPTAEHVVERVIRPTVEHVVERVIPK